jgi:hypothetical protein
VPSYIYKSGSPTTVTSGTNVYVYTGAATTARANYIKVYNGASWETVYQYDTTAPVVNSNRTTTGLSNANMRFAWSGGALVTDAESGVASVKIQVQYTPWGGSGEGWNDWQTLTLAQWQATSGSFDFTPSTSKRRQWSATSPYAETVGRYYLGFRVVAVDDVGNTTTSSEVAALTKPYGTLTVLPNSNGASGADSYGVSPAQWNGLTQGGVRFGDGTSSGLGNWTNGAYFYNTKLEDACLGYAPDSGTFFIQRKASQGISGTAYFKYHNLTFSAGATNATFGGDFVSFNLTGPSVSGTLAMPANWLSAIPTGTARGFGMLNGGSSTVIKVLYSWDESGSDSGEITITFN